MGRKLNKTTTAEAVNDGGALANLKDRQDAINKAFNDIFEIDEDIADARETHLKPLTDERTKLWRQLKADTGITQEDLKPYYQIHKRNKMAQDLGGDDGQRIQDNLRETFFAMQKGGQLNFIDSMQAAV